jgi:serine beta-lactamase-like protein LACTB, mitochondrial
LIAALAVSVLLAPAASAKPALTAGQATAVRALIGNTMATEHAPGATFAIGLNDRIVWSEGFGYADVENRVKATPETRYRTASIGKAMTATAAMELWEQGKLDLDAPIQKYCPQFPEKPWPITTRELLSHTSGIREPNETTELYNTRHYNRVSDALTIFANDPLTMRPGDDFRYTTWGYVGLGCVLEGASGEEYRALMQRLIFDPAGMSSTRDDDPRAIIPNRARGYILESGVLKNSGWADMSGKLPAGGWVTTASDLVRFLIAWMDGRFVSPKTQTLMLTPYVLPRHGGTVDGYGLGWFLDDYHGIRAGFHGGGTPKVSGIVWFVPERHIAIAGVFNLQNISGSTRVALAKAIADVVLGEKTPDADVHHAR